MEIPVKPDHVLTQQETDWMSSSLVYIRRRVRDGKALYVGAASCGLMRPLNNSHEKAKLKDGEVLEVYLTKEPLELEAKLIDIEKPLLNTAVGPGGAWNSNQECQVCGKLIEGKRKPAKYCSNSCRFKAWDRRYPRQRVAF